MRHKTCASRLRATAISSAAIALTLQAAAPAFAQSSGWTTPPQEAQENVPGLAEVAPPILIEESEAALDGSGAQGVGDPMGNAEQMGDGEQIEDGEQVTAEASANTEAGANTEANASTEAIKPTGPAEKPSASLDETPPAANAIESDAAETEAVPEQGTSDALVSGNDVTAEGDAAPLASEAGDDALTVSEPNEEAELPLESPPADDVVAADPPVEEVPGPTLAEIRLSPNTPREPNADRWWFEAVENRSALGAILGEDERSALIASCDAGENTVLLTLAFAPEAAHGAELPTTAGALAGVEFRVDRRVVETRLMIYDADLQAWLDVLQPDARLISAIRAGNRITIRESAGDEDLFAATLRGSSAAMTALVRSCRL